MTKEFDEIHQKKSKKTMFPKAKNKNRELVVGEDIHLDEIMEMLARVLVGRIRGRNYSLSVAQMSTGNLGTGLGNPSSDSKPTKGLVHPHIFS